MEHTRVTAAEIDALEDLADWRFVLGTLTSDFRAGSFPAAAALVAAVGDAAERAGHHPDVDIRYPDRVRVVLFTHAANALTTRDVDLARTISRLASEMGATAEPAAAQAIEVAIDTMDAARILPFWAAILGYRDAGGYLVDPLRIGPMMWFQEMDEPRPQRNRFHLDISVPHDVAEQRIAAAVAAGGTVVDATNARRWWVLADADGNEACISTWQDRES
jgi:4a-hydroxytetrahydrobiopterin dehydratase